MLRGRGPDQVAHGGARVSEPEAHPRGHRGRGEGEDGEYAGQRHERERRLGGQSAGRRVQVRGGEPEAGGQAHPGDDGALVCSSTSTAPRYRRACASSRSLGARVRPRHRLAQAQAQRDREVLQEGHRAALQVVSPRRNGNIPIDE